MYSELIQKVLSAGDVAGKNDCTNQEEMISLLERWLGMGTTPSTNVMDTDTSLTNMETNMEDNAPYSNDLYVAAQELLIAVWKVDPDALVDLSTSNFAVKLQQQIEEQNGLSSLSLYSTMESIRITRLLRFWMDLNIQDSSTCSTTTNTSLSHQLLSLSASNHADNDDSNVSLLITSLFQHVCDLPQIQSQIQLLNHSSKRKQQQPFNAALRLRQYQEIQDAIQSLNQELQNHISRLQDIIGEWYVIGSVGIRKQIRQELGNVWSLFVQQRISGGGGGVKMENTSATGISMTLKILHRILMGIDKSTTPLHKSYDHLLWYHLLPLHQPNSMVLWRDQTSLLELYHEPLVQCLAIIVQTNPTMYIPKVLNQLVQVQVIWPKGGNTPKQVLLLHEIDTLIGLLPEYDKDNVDLSQQSIASFMPVLMRIGQCIASDHSRLAERALSFWKNDKFISWFIASQYQLSVSKLLPCLVQKEPAWNPTVRKMTHTVLTKLQTLNPKEFELVCDQVFGGGVSTARAIPNKEPQQQQQPPSKKVHIDLSSSSSNSVAPKDFTLKSAMGSWKPPSSSLSSSSNKMPRPPGMMGPPTAPSTGRGGSVPPPLGVTGVAPWAIKNNNGNPRNQALSHNKNPPPTVTGVAPWAMSSSQKAKMPTGRKPAPLGKPLLGVSEKKIEEVEEEQEQGTDDHNSLYHDPKSNPGLELVLQYMEKIKPAGETADGSSPWSKAQMAETPTLLPDLKFHDLVFGHDLGSGAFGSVRYARRIDQRKTRSHWEEYAVKIVSTEKIKELGYEASIQREIATLQILSHPGIARLISSFKFREGVYLVLEYASGGDLHSLLRKHGSLDHESTKFVMGEIVAALASIHDLGLVYGDLKPENIVVTESGHIKLTDFGACRPVTPAAKEMISSSAKNLLENIRNGDWKPARAIQQTQPVTIEGNNNDDEDDLGWGGSSGKDNDHDINMDDDNNDNKKATKDDAQTTNDENSQQQVYEDTRIEGTTAYLPPEVVLGAIPTPAADSWALGCVLYQCLSGRPPIMEEEESLTRNRIVSFDIGEEQSSSPSASSTHSLLFSGDHAKSIRDDAKNLIQQLLQKHAMQRPSMIQVSNHGFFDGMDVFALFHQPAPPLDVGDVTPVADAQWSRRQFSSIWAPQPQAYNLQIPTGQDTTLLENTNNGPIPEGDEGPFYFAKITASRPLNLINISEKKVVS